MVHEGTRPMIRLSPMMMADQHHESACESAAAGGWMLEAASAGRVAVRLQQIGTHLPFP